MGIDHYAADVLQAAFLPISANLVGQFIGRRDIAQLMPLVQKRFPFRPAPEVVRERAKLFSDLPDAAGVPNDSFNLPARADHVGSVHDALDDALRILCNCAFIIF